MTKLLLVVEGPGDVGALPILARRVLQEELEIFDWTVDTHRRRDLTHQRANNWAHFRRYVEVAHTENCPIVWTIDCDDDCAWNVAHEMVRIVEGMRPRQPFAVAFWVREYESLFLSDHETTRGILGLLEGVAAPLGPESIRGARSGSIDHCREGAFTRNPSISQD